MEDYHKYKRGAVPLMKDELLRRNVIIPENELPSDSEMKLKTFLFKLKVICILIAVLLCVGLIGYCLSLNPKPEKDTVSTPNGLSAFYQSHYYVKQRIKSPSTAKFPNPLNNREMIGVDLGEGRFMVSAYVDAQNSFGVVIRNRYTCILKGIETVDGDRWILESIEFD